ncbi:PilZ domain-containing protein [Parendozoicomonas haliclonae]|uniref:PilZ domain protein n=1 Tax=Parendozoicomonas haliclonae TaxID=1960125 RepID=A0A1X7AF08_9GAMM|nr:PilZ domain-containing protein [Parendozoicomonas haliclonae]SMA34468.1 PilZ domain protein [Parendozoicomonas haliclonae]
MIKDPVKSSEQHQDKRREPRHTLEIDLELHNALSGEPIGKLVNLSEGGFMLSSRTPIPEGMVLQCLIIARDQQATPTNSGTSTINLGVEAVWQKEGNCQTQYWSGFRILDISEEDHQLVKKILAEHT